MIVKFLAIFLIAAAVATQLGHLHFTLDLLSNFKPYYLISFIFCIVFFVSTRSWVWAYVSLAGAIFNSVGLAHWYILNREAAIFDNEDSIKVMLSNVLMGNSNSQKLLELVERERPDILGLVEVNQRWIADLAPLRNYFEYHIEFPDERYAGLALYSHMPFKDPEIVNFGENSNATLTTVVEANVQSFRLVLTHPAPPMTRKLADGRNDQLRQIAEYVRTVKLPVVLIGDLNTTMWDRTYKFLVRKSQFINARHGAGIGPTWPAIPAIGIPIDHILITTPSRIGNFQILDGVGSDHFPVSARIQVLPRRDTHYASNNSPYLDEKHDEMAGAARVPSSIARMDIQYD